MNRCRVNLVGLTDGFTGGKAASVAHGVIGAEVLVENYETGKSKN